VTNTDAEWPARCSRRSSRNHAQASTEEPWQRLRAHQPTRNENGQFSAPAEAKATVRCSKRSSRAARVGRDSTFQSRETVDSVQKDLAARMVRTEVHAAAAAVVIGPKCSDDGAARPDPSARYCINGVDMSFKPEGRPSLPRSSDGSRFPNCWHEPARSRQLARERASRPIADRAGPPKSVARMKQADLLRASLKPSAHGGLAHGSLRSSPRWWRSSPVDADRRMVLSLLAVRNLADRLAYQGGADEVCRIAMRYSTPGPTPVFQAVAVRRPAIGDRQGRACCSGCDKAQWQFRGGLTPAGRRGRQRRAFSW